MEQKHIFLTNKICKKSNFRKLVGQKNLKWSKWRPEKFPRKILHPIIFRKLRYKITCVRAVTQLKGLFQGLYKKERQKSKPKIQKNNSNKYFIFFCNFWVIFFTAKRLFFTPFFRPIFYTKIFTFVHQFVFTPLGYSIL